jgi:hypothetical protein
MPFAYWVAAALLCGANLLFKAAGVTHLWMLWLVVVCLIICGVLEHRTRWVGR